MNLLVRGAVAIVVALAVAFGGYAIADTSQAAASTALGPGLVTVTVDIHYSKFSIDTLHVRRGTTVKFLAAKKVGVPNNYPGERVGDSEVEIELDAPKGLKPGALTLTAVGPNGESEYKPLVAEDQPKQVRLAATRGMLACAGKKE